jgi:hypothetical protein
MVPRPDETKNLGEAMLEHFPICVNELITVAEGGVLISESEHGGGANMGITLTMLRQWRKNPETTLEDLKQMPRSEAEAIYKAWFWDDMLLDQCESLLVCQALLNVSVHRGVPNAKDHLITTLRKHFAGRGGDKFSPPKETAQTSIKVEGTVPAKPEVKIAYVKPKWRELMPFVNELPNDRHLFWAFVCDVQDAYYDIANAPRREGESAEKAALRPLQLKGWLNRSQNLLRLLI